MRRLFLLTAFVVGCGPATPEVLGVTASIDDTERCKLQPEDPPHLGILALDTATAQTLDVPVLVLNDNSLPFIARSATVRFDCDPESSPAYESPGPLPIDDPTCRGPEVPALMTLQLGDQDVSPRTREPVQVPVVSDAFGRAVEALFVASARADECCRASQGTVCDGFATDASCDDVKAFLREQGMDETIAAPAPGERSEILSRLRAFSAWDGSYAPTENGTLVTSFVPPPLELRAHLEIQGTVGEEEVTLGAFSHKIGFCRECDLDVSMCNGSILRL